MATKYLLIFASLAIFFAFLLPITLADLEISEATRTVDISTQIVRQSYTFKFLNRGEKAERSFKFILSQEQHDHLSLIESKQAILGENTAPNSSPKTAKLGVSVPEKRSHGDSIYYEYTIDFLNALEPTERSMVFIAVHLTRYLEPFPATIVQDQSHLVRYIDSHFVFSPYLIASQETRIRLGQGRLESLTEKQPSSILKDTIKFGPYTNIDPFVTSHAIVHFQTVAPFLAITKLVKEIEVSHWGNVAIEERYNAEHIGAKLTGPFSRLDLQMRGAPTAIEGFSMILPSGASDAYYRDEIGNVSTSHFFQARDGSAKLDIQPRFVLFGGWKVSFYLGFNLPLDKYLSFDPVDPSTHVLNISFAKTFKEPLIIDDIEVKVILPEGATDIKYRTPFGLDQEPNFETRKTYLDTFGRPVLVLHKKNLINNHDQYFQVMYTFPRTKLLIEPILLVSSFLALFVAVIVLVRVNLSISVKK